MGIQGSINSMLGTAAAGKKLTDIAKQGKMPNAGAASNQTAPQQKAPIPTYDSKKAQTAAQFAQSNMQAKKEMADRAQKRRDKLGRFTKEGK